MKTYKADDELESLFLKLGLEEFTSSKDHQKGVKVFKTSKTNKKNITIDRDKIVVFPIGEMKGLLTVEEIKHTLLYLDLITNDFKELSPQGLLDFKVIENNLNELKIEFALLCTEGQNSTKRIKMTRIFSALNSINARFN